MDTNAPPVIIVGSSGHAKVVIDIFEREGRFRILGLVDAYRNTGEDILGYKVLGKEEHLPDLLAEAPSCQLFVAIGDNWSRQLVVNRILSIVPGISFASAIHPSAQLGKNVQIGDGVAMMAGSIVNSNTRIGDFAIINTKASIDHDSNMHHYSSLAPGATTGGNVSVGEYSAISIGATIKHGVIIGNHAVIGASALLMKNCEDYSVMYGIPARLIRKRNVGDKYL